jgi:hypothetical protein
MERHEMQLPDGKTIIGYRYSDEERNLIQENYCGTVRVLDNGADCGFDPLGQDVSFGEITPEAIIGAGVGNRHWSQRSKREMPVWHVHLAFDRIPWAICVGVHADTEDEAIGIADSEALIHLELNVLGPLPQEVIDDLLGGIEDVEDDKVAAYVRDLSVQDAYCLHDDLGEPCPDGCAKIRIAIMSRPNGL